MVAERNETLELCHHPPGSRLESVPTLRAMPKLSQAQRLGLLTAALSAWVEGSTQLRNVVLLLIADIPVTTSSWPDQPHSNDWRANFLHWLTRPARELDYGEKAVIAGLDLTVRCFIIKKNWYHK